MAQLYESPVVSVGLHMRGPTEVLVARGRLEGAAVVALEVQVEQLNCNGCVDVVLDAASLVGIDRNGVRTLRRLERRLAACGGRLTVLGAAPTIRRALDAEGVGRG
ncbi:MAG TPA: hypothetical protein VKV06_03560 [Acidimicrobiales bacterium]|nr:hypothetical protein [Acidimicrobiales bacterium]